ncbi:MAG: SRPBCC family protein [Thermoplasmatota archaeon]
MARTYSTESSALTKAPLPLASRVITDPANLPRWFKGASDVEATKGYPALGGVLRWTVRWAGARWTFGGKVVESDLPHRLIVQVATRSSRGTTTHLFEAVETGTRYTKRVDSEGSWWELLGARLYMPRSVRKEVKAAARLADESV